MKASDAKKHPQHATATTAELTSIMANGVFSIVPRSEIKPGDIVVRSRWVYTEKVIGGQITLKARLV
ncbi:unnamed protein product, partial [Amoebophrya sp. A120]|eukprot:GSA120T00021934001.1